MSIAENLMFAGWQYGSNGRLYKPVMSREYGIVKESAVQPGGAVDFFIRGGRVYYADYSERRVAVFDAKTLERLGVTGTVDGTLKAVCADDTRIFCSDDSVKKIIAFDAETFKKVGETATQSGASPSIIVAGGKYVYYLDGPAKKVIAFNKETLSKACETATISNFIFLDGSRVDIAGNLLIAYTPGNAVIYVFDASTLGQIKTVTAESLVKSAVFRDGKMYVSRVSKDTLSVYDAATAEKIRERQFPGVAEFTSLNASGENLRASISSSSSSTTYFLDYSTLETIDTIGGFFAPARAELVDGGICSVPDRRVVINDYRYAHSHYIQA